MLKKPVESERLRSGVRNVSSVSRPRSGRTPKVIAPPPRGLDDPPPAAFRAIDSPLVAWIWIGGGLALLGALIAAWPSPEARLRRVTSLYAARLGRELSRA